ncbi:MAG: hypothetical protein M1836_000984 [Candelina mexicana]|nr:MAG: hypothetical protein M1836_000984 [Candelina mexicana]
MFTSPTTLLSLLLALLPFAFATPTPVNPNHGAVSSDAPLATMTFFTKSLAHPNDLHAVDGCTGPGQQLGVSIFADKPSTLQTRCSNFGDLEMVYFTSTMSTSPVPDGKDIILHETEHCADPGTRLSLFDVGNQACNRAEKGAQQTMVVKSVSVRWAAQ